MQLTGQRVLVTGGAGFIGSHLVDGLIARRPKRIVVVDNLWLGKEENLVEARKARPDLGFHKEHADDAAALRGIVRRERIDIVFNLATRPLNYSFENPDGAFQVNVDLARNCAELLREKAFGALVQYSSSEVYGTARRAPMNEDHPCRPTTPYAAGKLAADLLLDSYVALYGLKVLTIRPFNNYGPRQNAGSYAAVIPLTLRRLFEGEPPILEGTGRQTRDFIYVGDTVRLTLELVESPRAWGRTVNLASGRETRIGALIDAMCRAAGYQGPIDRRTARPGDHARHIGGTRLARSLVDFGRLTPVSEGLRRTVEWYRGQATLGR